MASYRIKKPMFCWSSKKKIKKMIHEFNKPIPVVVENTKEGYAIYVESGGQFENYIWCVVHCEGGIVRHYLTNEIRIFRNSTFGIEKNTR